MAKQTNPSNPLFDQMCEWIGLNPNHVDAIYLLLNRNSLPTVTATVMIPNVTAYDINEYEIIVRKVDG